MIKVSAIIAFVFAASLLASTCGHDSLSEEEALELLRAAGGYPKYFHDDKSVQVHPQLTAEVDNLMWEGCIQPIRGTQTGFPEQCSDKISRASWHPASNWNVTFITHLMDIEVQEVLTEAEQGRALVEYRIHFTPTEYYSARVLPNLRTLEFEPGEVSQTRTARLVKYDQGWRVVRM